MKILFVSHLGQDRAAGLCWSVPASVSAQSLLDTCLWINTEDSFFEHWGNVKAFRKLSSLGSKLSLRILPQDFCNPDIVVFEGFYHMEALSFARELYKSKIPYIIVPRSSLTKQAFHNHGLLNCLKKRIAFFLCLNRYVKRAAAIQYLTEVEFKESGTKWNARSFVVPNGINIPPSYKKSFSEQGIRIVYIGRPTVYQKGLDLLIDCCKILKQELIKAHVTIDCHIPRKNDYGVFIERVSRLNISEVFTIKKPVYDMEKEEVLLNSDVFIMTSRFEGLPMGLIEAMSYGIPVAVTNGTNMAHEVSESDAGWVASCDEASICNMLMQIIEDRNMFYVKGRNARDLAKKYEWRSIAEDFHRKVSNLIGSK